MTIYFFWGDDDFVINQQITNLKQEKIDTNWLQFNFQKFSGDKEDEIQQALTEAMTPPFGSGDRIVILEQTTICQQANEELLTELQKTLPQIPTTTHLLFTSQKKPNGKLKITKLINKYAQVKEFSLIPPWQTEALVSKVAEMANQKRVKLTQEATKILADCVGNDSLLLYQELKKLAIYQGENKKLLDEKVIKSLVNVSSKTSLQLAEAIVNQNLHLALQLVQDLLNSNEPPLRIVATLVGQFRTWAIVKTAIEAGEKNENTIAELADIRNPKRVYFIKKQISKKSARNLNLSLPILLELEASLKLGAKPLEILESTIIQLCTLLN